VLFRVVVERNALSSPVGGNALLPCLPSANPNPSSPVRGGCTTGDGEGKLRVTGARGMHTEGLWRAPHLALSATRLHGLCLNVVL
jgi:hypothetical protein